MGIIPNIGQVSGKRKAMYDALNHGRISQLSISVDGKSVRRHLENNAATRPFLVFRPFGDGREASLAEFGCSLPGQH
jgi:hypothetical protein